MEIVTKNLDEIKPYPNNPRVNDQAVQAVMESIRQCEYVSPIVVDENDVILAGHTRLKALQKLGESKCEVVVKSGLTDDQKRKYRLLDNKTAELSEWDFDKLAEEIDGLDFGNLDLDWGIDFGNDPDLSEDDYDEDPPDEPIAKRGDVYQLGKHRLMCGDSTNAADVECLMGGSHADICITSPPYGMGNSAHLRKHLVKGVSTKDDQTFYGDSSDDPDSWPELMDGFFKCAQSVTESQFINVEMVADNKISLVNFVSKNRDNLVDIIVWNKHTCPPQAQSNVLNNGYEFVFVFDNDNGSRSIRFGDFRGTKSNYIETKREQNQFSDVHKAVYSVEFVGAMLDINSKATSCYDPFGGTGTTMIACEQLNCTCYMMELEPKYVDLIIDRWENLTGEKAVKLNGEAAEGN